MFQLELLTLVFHGNHTSSQTIDAERVLFQVLTSFLKEFDAIYFNCKFNLIIKLKF